MPTFKELLKTKNAQLVSVPNALQTVAEKEQKKILKGIQALVSELDVKNGQIIINKRNLKLISEIDSELKKVFLTDEYVDAVKEFAKGIDKQAVLNDKLIKSGFGEVKDFAASEAYLDIAKKGAIKSFIGAPIDTEFIKPIQSLLENSVASGASVQETIKNIETFIIGNDKVDGKLLRYTKQISNDTFAITDRTYTSIVSDLLESEWFYYAGGEIDTTRCFCNERVGKYFHYKEIESWGNGENLGECNIGGGKWAGQIDGTNSKTIYSYLGGYNCMHSLMPVSEAVVPESDIERAKSLGYI